MSQKITLIKASGDMETIEVPKDITSIKKLREYLELSNTTRIIEAGKELGVRTKVGKGMKLVIIPKETQA